MNVTPRIAGAWVWSVAEGYLRSGVTPTSRRAPSCSTTRRRPFPGAQAHHDAQLSARRIARGSGAEASAAAASEPIGAWRCTLRSGDLDTARLAPATSGHGDARSGGRSRARRRDRRGGRRAIRACTRSRACTRTRSAPAPRPAGSRPPAAARPAAARLPPRLRVPHRHHRRPAPPDRRSPSPAPGGCRASRKGWRRTQPRLRNLHPGRSPSRGLVSTARCSPRAWVMRCTIVA